MDKIRQKLGNLNQHDLSGGDNFSLAAREFPQDIQAIQDKIMARLRASENYFEDSLAGSLIEKSPADKLREIQKTLSRDDGQVPLFDTAPELVEVSPVSVENKFSEVVLEENKALETPSPLGENLSGEGAHEVPQNLPYQYYYALPKEAKHYPTIVVNKMTVSTAPRSEFYQGRRAELDFDNYDSNRPAKTKSKGASFLSNAIFYLIIIVLLIFVESRLILQNENEKPINIAGFSPMTVLSNSMRSVYPRDTFLLTRQVDPNTLNIGDDITFITESDRVVTHRITGIEENHLRTRERGFTTKGVDNQREDTDMVHASNIIGQVIFSSYPLGRAIHFIRNNLIVSVIVMLISMLLLHEIMNFIVMAIKHKRLKTGHRGKRRRHDVTEGKALSHEAV